MVTLVKNVIADEELRRESPQKLLVINRCTLGGTLELQDTSLPRETRVYLLPLQSQCHSNVRVRPTSQW